MSSSTYTAIFVGTGILLLLAIADMPWGYYELLRWAVVVAGVLLIVRSLKVEQTGWTILGGFAILFFFPPFGVSFEKQVWAFFDFAFGIAFISAGLTLKKLSS
jgi:hypothetical protein